MKRLWLFIWLLLFIGQALGLWLVRTLLERTGGYSEHPDPEMIELARSTIAAWPVHNQELQIAMAPEVVLPHDINPAQALLQREALLLRLREQESILAASGVDVSLTADLEAWLAGRPELDTGAVVAGYLGEVLAWLEDVCDPNASTRLQRLAIHPDRWSEFPSLAFEWSGDPAVMGAGLHAMGLSHGHWQLREMDLYRSGRGQAWWMRGSYSFAQSE